MQRPMTRSLARSYQMRCCRRLAFEPASRIPVYKTRPKQRIGGWHFDIADFSVGQGRRHQCHSITVKALNQSADSVITIRRQQLGSG